MKILGLSLLLILFPLSSFSISLTQEEKEILCHTNGLEMTIEKKDRYFEAQTEKYRSIEFLDRAILGQAQNNKIGLIHLAPQSQGVFIRGVQISMSEKNCVQIKAFKRCERDGQVVDWSPTYLKVNGEEFPQRHYGVYPNDGTFHIAYNAQRGAALVDFGSKFIVIVGAFSKLQCSYKN